jgi:hypothetical protein
MQSSSNILKELRRALSIFGLPGGWSQQETFDPKPLLTLEYRGEMGTVETALPGIRFNQHLKKTAKIADKITVIRSMTHW